jgi:uncharacterized integral membrane protein (TIGR00698 family)
MSARKILFILLIVVCLSPIGSPPIALALGLILALVIGNPFPQLSKKPAKFLLQASVVLLGFGLNLNDVYRSGRQGILYTIVTLFGTLLLGYGVGKLLSVRRKTSTLISAGTAICGGSAIAAVAPVINAESDEISVSLGTVFVLNSIALFVFPVIGHELGLTQNQFGIWSAIAIHDTSSVVGAAAAYGQQALAVAATVKLARALWIAPVALMFLFIYRDKNDMKAKVMFPWFILFFLLATVIRSYAPPSVLPSIFDSLVNLAKAGMTITLFLIGAGLSRATLKAVGVRPMVQGIILWLVISVAGLVAVSELL